MQGLPQTRTGEDMKTRSFYFFGGGGGGFPVDGEWPFDDDVDNHYTWIMHRVRDDSIASCHNFEELKARQGEIDALLNENEEKLRADLVAAGIQMPVSDFPLVHKNDEQRAKEVLEAAGWTYTFIPFGP